MNRVVLSTQNNRRTYAVEPSHMHLGGFGGLGCAFWNWGTCKAVPNSGHNGSHFLTYCPPRSPNPVINHMTPMQRFVTPPLCNRPISMPHPAHPTPYPHLPSPRKQCEPVDVRALHVRSCIVHVVYTPGSFARAGHRE